MTLTRATIEIPLNRATQVSKANSSKFQKEKGSIIQKECPRKRTKEKGLLQKNEVHLRQWRRRGTQR